MVIPLGKTYGTLIDRPPLNPFKKIINPIGILPAKDYLLSYAFGREKAYLLLENKRSYFYIANRWYTVPLCLTSPVDLLIEGDITEDNVFLLSDILSSKDPFPKRLKQLNTLLAEAYRYDPIIDPFRIEVTDYVSPPYIEHFIGEYARAYKPFLKGWLILSGPDYQERSLVALTFPFRFPVSVKQVVLPVILNPTRDTVVFHIKATPLPDVYHLYVQGNQYYDLACVPDKITSAFLNETIATAKCYTCRFNFTFRRWQPISVSSRIEPEDYKEIK
jgi:hypothetical protein